MSRFEKITSALFASIAMVALAGCASENVEPVSATKNTCPVWVEHPVESHSNEASAYLGCTNALNLNHMVEDKADLHEGRELGPADGERASKAITDYQQDKVKSSTGTASSHAIFAPVMTGTSTEAQ